MKTLLRTIDWISSRAGLLSGVFCICLIATLGYEVGARYLFNAPTTWAHLTSTMFNGTLAAFALSYVHFLHFHIRIDLLLTKLSDRQRAICDAAFGVLLFLPLLAVLTYSSWHWAWISWLEHERLGTSVWCPPAAPLRTMIFAGWLLFLLQCAVQVFRDCHYAVRGQTI